MEEPKSEKPKKETPAEVSKPVNTDRYVVQEGDYIIKIAKRHKMSWVKLAEINKLKAPFNLKTGQKLKLK